MSTIKKNKGFVVLLSTMLLSVAAISLTTNMAGTQLIDNQVMANYYRSSEAFINAESGVHMILSQIDKSSSLLAFLPLSYRPSDNHYTVDVERVNKNTVAISSSGRSKDGSAQRTIQLQIYHQVSYNVPKSALSSNGKLNLDATTIINNGCEGLNAEQCNSPGNLAKYSLISAPSNETQQTDLCTGTSLGENLIEDGVFSGENNNIQIIGEEKNITDKEGNALIDAFGDKITELTSWSYEQPAGSVFYDLPSGEHLSPSTLFESTFGVNREAGIDALQVSSDVVTIDTQRNGAASCSKQLLNIDKEISTIYIKGDCKIEESDTFKSITSGNNRFTIGSVDYPKQVFIEGGHFITEANIDTSIIGMLYFLPGKHPAVDENNQLVLNEDGETVLVEDNSIEMNGIRVNGALLSDYNCSYAGNQGDNLNNNVNFSVRYDKTVLNKLYKNIGSVVVNSGYSIIEGSWRDF